jgi:hypothetical protein
MLCFIVYNLIDMKHEILDMRTVMVNLKSNISHLKIGTIT